MTPKNLISACIVLTIFVSMAAAISPDTNIRLDPHPDHISFYNNSTYITVNYTIQESVNVTIKFERYNITDNSTDEIFDLGEFTTNQTNETNLTTANFSTVGWYRAVMFDVDGAELCMYWIAVRDNTSANYEALHGSVRFTDADSVPSVSFIEPISGRGTTWTTDSISETHSIELWEFDGSAWSYAAGGNYSYLDHINTSANETNWVLPSNYTLGNTYAMVIYSHDYEALDVHFVEAVVPTSNVVEVTAEDVETGEAILTFTATLMDVTKSSSDGKAIFTNVTNGEHIIVVQADNYQNGVSSIYMANSFINETVYLLRYSPYTAPHYVKFKVVNIFRAVYKNIAVDVNYTATSGEYANMNGTTGTDGAVVFLMTPSIQYTLTFTNATQGVNITFEVYPKDSEYDICVDSFSFSLPENDTIRHNVDWYFTKNRINLTHAWLNFTYQDDLNQTWQVEYWINRSWNNSYENNSYYFISTTNGTWTSNSTYVVNQIVNADNTTYIVHFGAEHETFGTLGGSYRNVVSFYNALRIDLGFSEQWQYEVVALCCIIFLGLLFGAVTAATGAVICVMSGWFMIWIGWLSGTSTNFTMLVLATIIAFAYSLRKSESLRG
jgi:hypothetical protein